MYNKLINRNLRALLGLAIVLIGLNSTVAQGVTYQVTENSQVKISGTSSLHDWHMGSMIEDCIVEVNSAEDKNVLELTSISFEMPIIQLKSDQKKMDGIAQKALKLKEYKNIQFTSNTPQKIDINKEGKRSVVKGVLEIAGVKRDVELNVLTTLNEEGKLSFQFTHPIHMEDYSVEPPSLMFGAITTGSDIQAEFELNLNKINQ